MIIIFLILMTLMHGIMIILMIIIISIISDNQSLLNHLCLSGGSLISCGSDNALYCNIIEYHWDIRSYEGDSDEKDVISVQILWFWTLNIIQNLSRIIVCNLMLNSKDDDDHNAGIYCWQRCYVCSTNERSQCGSKSGSGGCHLDTKCGQFCGDFC